MKKRVISFILALAMVCSLLPGVSLSAAAAEADSYTYRSHVSSLPWDWNPHTWTSGGASTVMEYIETPLVDIVVSDSDDGIYQWAYLAAESVTDVTADHQDDLVKYGADSTDATSGYVFDIALNPDMKWQDGTPINADTYVYSMQQLLDPDMQNYRANLYYNGTAAIAGAYNYYYSTTEGYYVSYADVYESVEAAAAETEVYIDVWGFWDAEGYIDAEGNPCAQYILITDETEYSLDGAGTDAFSAAAIYRDYSAYFEIGTGYESYVVIYQKNPNMGVGYDTVGLYKVDDYTIRYVTQREVDINYFLTSLTDNWIVHEALYESCKASGTYGTSVDTTMSYGPYMLQAADPNSQFVLVQNPNHYEYTVNADGSLCSATEFLVDGQHVSQWQTTKIVLTVMNDASAKAAFLAGQLDEWAPTADDVVTYAASDRLYKVDETYTMSLYFNTNLEALQAMDAGQADYQHTNAVVLSNENFRKAFSLAIDRADWVTVTAGYKPALGVMNNLYYYDIYNDPSSSYRYSKQAMAAMCDLYGVSYTEDTLREVYDSLTGYHLPEAKALMAQACRELVEAGLYTEGEEIFIQMAWSNSEITDVLRAQAAKLTAYLNAAAEGSGFGTITLNPVGNSNRYSSVNNGHLPIGYGAWGGAAFYPFQFMGVYLDPENYPIQEAACWNPAAENLTLTVNGEDVTMTWAQWSWSCTGGAYHDADIDTKLAITAALETEFLAKYYRIPLAGTTVCSMLSHKLDYYTQEYNTMYGFGGLRLMRYDYTDAQWETYVASGELDYGGSNITEEPALMGKSLSLKGDIGVNFYMQLTEDMLADPNTRMAFQVGDETQVMYLADALADTQKDGTVWYRFSCTLPAKGMADEITAQLYGSGGAVGEVMRYSVAAYYDDICSQYDREEKAELFALIEAMLNYGAASQEYFGYNTDNPANAAVSAPIPEAVDASAYAAQVSGSETVLAYAGMSLVLESNTALRVFFRAAADADISSYTFTANGQTVTPIQRGSLWYIELTDIAAKDLDTAYTFTAGGLTVACSALSYVNSVLRNASTMDQKLVAVCKALYAYNDTANAYFE